MLKKFSPAGFKSIGDEGTFEGYASNFGVLDQGGDIVVAGAYSRTIAERGARGIKMLLEHCGMPIGVWEDLREDGVGLWAKGRLLLEVERAREAYTLLKAGALDGLSIGYRVVNSARDAANGARMLQEIDLREISLVTFPMNEQSLVASVKGDLPTEREFERWLTQDAGFSRSHARQIIAGGYKALIAKPGAGEDGKSTPDEWSGIAAELAKLSDTLTK